MKITAILEKGKDGYSVSFQEISNVYGFGVTVDEAKKDAREALDAFITYLKEKNKPLPNELQGDFELSFEFDINTLLELAEKVVTLQALAAAAKINPGQLSHYKNGVKPRPEQRRKIVEGLHNIGRELLTVS